jgi:hypothetical protein
LPDFRLIGDVVFYRRVMGEGGPRVGSLIEELRRREAAPRAEADRLRSRIEELAEDLAGAEEQVSGLAGRGARQQRLRLGLAPETVTS